MTDVTDIFNMTLDMMEEAARVESPTEDKPLTRRLYRNYAQTRDEILEMHPWNFAKTRVSINKMTENPAFGWKYQYALPEDFIRLHPVQDGGTFEGDMVPHEIESYKVASTGVRHRVIVTDQVQPLKVMYTARITDTSHFSPLFTRALVAQLCVYTAYGVTRKMTFVNNAKDTLKSVLLAARASDNLQVTHAKPNDSDWIAGRQQEYTG